MTTISELQTILGKNIKFRREARKWSQELLATKIKVNKNTITDIECGFQFVRVNTLVSLANVLETEPYELLKPENIYPDNQNDIRMKCKEDLKDKVMKYVTKL